MNWLQQCPRCTRNFTNELGSPKVCPLCVRKEAETIAALAEAIEDRESMDESTTDRRIFAEIDNATNRTS